MVDQWHPGADSRPGILQFAYREMLSPHMVKVALATTGSIVGVFVLLGPMGTIDTLTPLQRLMYGTLYALLGWPVFYALSVMTLYFRRHRSPRDLSLSLTIAALFAAMPCSAMVCALETLVHPEDTVRAGLLRVYLLVATFGVGSNLMFFYMVYQRIKLTSATEAETDADVVAALVQEATVPGPVARPEVAAWGERQGVAGRGGDRQTSLLEFLPRELGGDIIYLKSEDHYVKVVTSTGSGLIKKRFADAVAELGETGIQVHRCYWVASRHVQELTKHDGKLLLRLAGNHEVPVSRTYLGVVRLASGGVRGSAPAPG